MTSKIRQPFLALVALAVALSLGAAPALRAAGTPHPDATRSPRYQEGQRALADEHWPEALASFTSIADAGGADADAALYWKAWTEKKLGKSADALVSLRSLESRYPKSSWIDDARALEIDLRGGAAGRAVASGAAGGAGNSGAPGGGAAAGAPAGGLSADQDLQLYALDGLMQADPARAVPILERFLAGDHPLKLKQRALFVLSQSTSPRARAILLETARHGMPPEIQSEAVRDLGIAGGPDDLAALSGLWKDASPEVKRTVLEAWLVAGQSRQVLDAAQNEPDPALRRKAIDELGAMNADKELEELYASEKDPDLRAKIVQSMGVAGDVDALARLAANENDPALRRRAAEGIAIAGGPQAGARLAALYTAEKDPATKEGILNAFLIAGDAHALVDLFKREKDPEMKKKIVRTLSLMDSPEATSLIDQLLGAGS